MQVIFRDNWDSGAIEYKGSREDNAWNAPERVGADFEIIADPTNSNRGNVLKCKIVGNNAVLKPEWGGQRYWRSAFPQWAYSKTANLPAPCGVEAEVFIPDTFRHYFNPLGVHRRNIRTGDTISDAGYEINSRGQLILLTRDGDGRDTRVTLAKSIRYNDWTHLELLFLPDGAVLPIVNGETAYGPGLSPSKVPIKDYPGGFTDARTGIVKATDKPEDGCKDGDYILCHNFRILQG